MQDFPFLMRKSCWLLSWPDEPEPILYRNGKLQGFTPIQSAGLDFAPRIGSIKPAKPIITYLLLLRSACRSASFIRASEAMTSTMTLKENILDLP